MDQTQKFAPIRTIMILGALASITLMLLAVGGYYLLIDNIKAAEYRAAEINISGRQRMLTERIALSALSVAAHHDPTTRAKALGDLKAAIHQITVANRQLNHRPLSPPLLAIYSRPPFDIHARLAAYLDDATAFARAEADTQTVNNPHLARILSASDRLVSAFNAVTRQYQREADANTVAIQRKAIAVMAIELTTVVLLALFVFWPLIRRIRDNLKRIVEIETVSRTIMNSMKSGLIGIDEDGVVISFNPAAERLFGYRSEEVLGRNVDMLMPEPYRSEHDSYLHRYRTTDKSNVLGIGREVVGQRKDYGVFPMHLTVSEMQLGERRYFIGDLRDLTQDKEAEQNLLAAKERAELANRAKDSFLTTMSHEIRTPLSGMLGMLEVLSLSKLDREQSTTLQAAWESGKGLLRIVSDILDWSKIDEGKLTIVPRPTSLPQVLQEVINTYSRVASSKNLRLWHHTDPRIAPAHLVDALRLSQVLNNFVSNAIKFTTQGGIELRADLLESIESGERIRFSVKDTGVGIPKQVQQQLFQRYKQESADTARLYGGTGLGLAICRRLTDLMDGQIELDSEPGIGSTFSITLVLPVGGAPEELASRSDSEVLQQQIIPLSLDEVHAPAVLVVDDHPINRDLLSRQIQLLGLRAETAGDGLEGFSLWQTGRFALVITDCHMPELDGYGLSRRIREAEIKDQPSLHIPIIGWTANAVGDEGSLCHAAGMDDLLIKPTNMKQLRASLAKWLNLAEPVSAVPMEARKLPSGAEAEPIDYAILDKIVPDRSAQGQVLADYMKHIERDRTKLLEVMEQSDPVQVERTAHRMKGSSQMVGARRLARACQAIESAAGNGLMDAAREALANLDGAFELLKTHLDGVIGHE